MNERHFTARLKGFTLALVLFLTGCTERRQLSLVREAEDLANKNRNSDAAEVLRRAISLSPESKTGVKARYKLGFIQESYLKDFEGALSNYEQFIRLGEDAVSVYEVQKRIANIYFDHHRDPERAIAAYKKLLSMNRDSLEEDFFQFRIAQGYFRQNNFDQARVEYQQLLERFPKSQFNARSRFEIGNSYYMEGKYDVALEALKQVLRQHPESEYAVEAQFLMAQCLEHQDKLPNALQVYESIASIYSSPQVLKLRMDDLKKRIRKEK